MKHEGCGHSLIRTTTTDPVTPPPRPGRCHHTPHPSVVDGPCVARGAMPSMRSSTAGCRLRCIRCTRRRTRRRTTIRSWTPIAAAEAGSGARTTYASIVEAELPLVVGEPERVPLDQAADRRPGRVFSHAIPHAGGIGHANYRILSRPSGFWCSDMGSTTSRLRHRSDACCCEHARSSSVVCLRSLLWDVGTDGTAGGGKCAVYP